MVKGGKTGNVGIKGPRVASRFSVPTPRLGCMNRDFPFGCTWNRSRLRISPIVTACAPPPVSSAWEILLLFFLATPVFGFLSPESRSHNFLVRLRCLLCVSSAPETSVLHGRICAAAKMPFIGNFSLPKCVDIHKTVLKRSSGFSIAWRNSPLQM